MIIKCSLYIFKDGKVQLGWLHSHLNKPQLSAGLSVLQEEIRAESEVVVVLERMKEEVGVLCKFGAQSVKGKRWIKRNTMED